MITEKESIQKVIKGQNWYNTIETNKKIQEYLLKNITKLETNSTIVGTIDANAVSVGASQSETLFRVGKRYIVKVLTPGDNFSNVGFVSVNVPFIATATTPTTQTTSQVFYLKANVNIFFNDLDPNIQFETNFDSILNTFITEVKITNNKFNPLKVYPVFGTFPEIRNSNLLINGDQTGGYFKIEVYN